MDLISIIVPVYNVEKYICQCVDSIINQTYKNLEIILVDDGSPDNCGKICDEYARKDNRIKVIHKENGGLSSARNAGLDIATGEYISFIDSDDYVSENFIGILYTLCQKNDADVAECDFLKFESTIEIKENNEQVKILEARQMQFRLFTNDYIRTVVVWNKLYKRYIYESLRFPVGKINEDEYTTFKAFWNCERKVIVTNSPLYYYRYNPNSIMGRKFNEKRLDALQACEIRNLFYKEKLDLELYSMSIVSYARKLKEYYWLVSKYIDSPQKYMLNIMRKSKDNYKEMCNIPSITFTTRMKIKLFILFPKLYCIFLDMKNFEKIKE